MLATNKTNKQNRAIGSENSSVKAIISPVNNLSSIGFKESVSNLDEEGDVTDDSWLIGSGWKQRPRKLTVHLLTHRNHNETSPSRGDDTSLIHLHHHVILNS